jgi:hypothetical protein
MQAYPVYRSLWESLDAIIFTKGISLAKELAAELNVSPKELLAHLNQKEQTKFIIVPDEDNTLYQCEGLHKCGKVYLRCRIPVLGPSPRYCQKHSEIIMEMPKLPLVKLLIASEESYVVKLDTQEVFDLNGKQCGHLKESTLIHFEIEE